MKEKIFNPEFQVEKARKIGPETLARILKKRKSKSVLITGGKLLEDEILADLIAELVKKSGIKVIATGGSSKPLIERGINVNTCLLSHITEKLTDVNILIFVGFEPYLLSRLLSNIKHFLNVLTVSIDFYYQPNAKLSFPNCDNYGLIETLVSCLSDC